MAIKLKRKSEKQEESWLLTYGDTITLLLCFFVMLYSMSEISQAKLEMVTQNFQTTEKKEMKLTAIKDLVQEMIKEEKLENEVNAVLTPRGVEITFSETLLFPSGKAEIQTRGKDVLAKIADKALNDERIKNRQVIVEGHTDSVPIRTRAFPSNWELSSARSSRVVRFFIEHASQPERFTAVGYADIQPPKGSDGKTPIQVMKGKPQAEMRRAMLIVK